MDETYTIAKAQALRGCHFKIQKCCKLLKHTIVLDKTSDDFLPFMTLPLGAAKVGNVHNVHVVALKQLSAELKNKSNAITRQALILDNSAQPQIKFNASVFKIVSTVSTHAGQTKRTAAGIKTKGSELLYS